MTYIYRNRLKQQPRQTTDAGKSNGRGKTRRKLVYINEKVRQLSFKLTALGFPEAEERLAT